MSDTFVDASEIFEDVKRKEAARRQAESEGNWPVMDKAAYYGLAGDAVNIIGPHSEADPIAILIQVLTFFGNVIGSGAYYQVEADRHHTNLCTVLVGVSAKGRKGTSAGRARSVFAGADEQWTRDRQERSFVR